MYVLPQTGIILEKCIHWLHTHDETGIIHIESPTEKDFTPGQFFDLRKRKLNNIQIYINGTKLLIGTSYRDIKIHAHDEVALVYGTPPDDTPSKYDHSTRVMI